MPNDAPAGVTAPATEATQATVAPNAGSTAQPAAAPIEGNQQPAPKTFTQEELEAEVGKRVAREQRKFQRSEAERIARVEQEVAQLRQSAPQADPEPKREQFKTDDEYFWALHGHRVKLEVRAERERERQEESQARQRDEQQRARQTYQQRVTAAEVKYPDYHEVVGSPTLPITDAMATAIQLHEQGPEVAYHLGKNVAEAQRIANLPPLLAAAEIGAIAAQLKARPASTSQPSKAPEPITPVGGKTVTEKNPSDMTDEEFARWRKSHKKRR